MRAFFAFLLFCSLGLKAQENDNWQLTGYLKYLGSYSFLNEDFIAPTPGTEIDLRSFDQQVHNRIDLRYFWGAWTASVGLRNRLFQGASPKQGLVFSQALDTDPGLVDLSMVYWESDQVILHSIVDRLWLQYEAEKWSLRLGRQRINWGMTGVFNPNDLLNQYNFLDFDYEERPGADALRFQFFPDFYSHIEMAISANDKGLQTAAMLYRNNRYRYDFQLIAAYYDQYLTAGGGWAGAIGGMGFKGEANYYLPQEEGPDKVLVASIDLDYVFSNGLYLTLGYLYNQSAAEGLGVLAFNSLNAGQVLSPRNPYIYRNTGLLTLSYPFNPLISGSFTGMYSPDANSTILFPSLSYSLGTNWDVLVAGQLFLADNDLQASEYDWFVNALFIRLKWSF